MPTQRIQNSEAVPTSLRTALKTLQDEASRKAIKRNFPVVRRKVVASNIPFRHALAHRKLVAHGAGVYEDQQGDLWYREGEFLVRKNIDTNKLVEDYLKTCIA
jgi:hypothetical protein